MGPFFILTDMYHRERAFPIPVHATAATVAVEAAAQPRCRVARSRATPAVSARVPICAGPDESSQYNRSAIAHGRAPRLLGRRSPASVSPGLPSLWATDPKNYQDQSRPA